MSERTDQQLDSDVDNTIRFGRVASREIDGFASNPMIKGTLLERPLSVGWVTVFFMGAALRHPEWAQAWIAGTGIDDLESEIGLVVGDLPIAAAL